MTARPVPRQVDDGTWIHNSARDACVPTDSVTVTSFSTCVRRRRQQRSQGYTLQGFTTSCHTQDNMTSHDLTKINFRVQKRDNMEVLSPASYQLHRILVH